MAVSDDKELKQAELQWRLKRIEDYLFGHDGNKGKIAQMDEKLDKMKEDVHKLRTSVLIIVAASSSAVGGAGVYIVKVLMGAG
jgi:hypothetical protein